MDSKRIKDLHRSLVGSSIEFRFPKNIDASTLNVDVIKASITKDVNAALEIGGTLAVMLLAELTNRYMKEYFYMQVRSAIEMRRFRPEVLEYLKLSVDEREERLHKILKSKSHRDVKISALKYFLTTYPSRTKHFRDVLTREEFLIVS